MRRLEILKTKGAQQLGSALRAAVVVGVAVVTGACTADGPDRDVLDPVLDSVTASLPEPVADLLGGEWGRLDSVTIRVWAECARSGAIGMVGTPYRTGINCRFAIVDDYPRRFVVYLPAGREFTRESPAPVVVMHHGSSGNGEQFLNISGWREESDEHGFITAFPTGLVYDVLDGGNVTKWNSFGLASAVNLNVRPPGYPEAAPWPANDVLFESGILDDLEDQIAIDPQRLYAAGFSNGAEFTARLGVELSDRYAAVGLFAGALDQDRPAHERISVILGFGNEDDRFIAIVNAALAAEGRPPLTRLPIDPDSLSRLSAVNTNIDRLVREFDFDANQFAVTTDHQTITQIRWDTPGQGNRDGTALLVAVLARVSHQFPRGPRPGKTQNNPLGFDAADRFWSFFAQHPRQ